MTISEMYENNKNVKDLEEEIANHNAVIASGKKVGEMYFEQLKSMKEKYSSMSVISEKQIDDKVNEYEKKLDEYEKNNNRINELSELIESHNAMVISGRQVSEGYFKQIEEYKKELASMREIPHNKIMAYKRELAIAYKEKIKSAPEINKRYDETKEMVENHRAMFASGRIVGEKYGEQLVNNENKISELKRVSKTDIDKWEKVIEDVEKDDKEIGKLKELIETQQSLMVSGIIGGKDAVKKQDELKRQLKERMISVKEIEENDKTVKDQGNNFHYYRKRIQGKNLHNSKELKRVSEYIRKQYLGDYLETEEEYENDDTETPQKEFTLNNENIPVYVFYGVDRYNEKTRKLRRRYTGAAGKLDAWRDSAFGGVINFRLFFEWFRGRQEYENSIRVETPNAEDPQLHAVKKAILNALGDGFSEIRVKVTEEDAELIVIKKELELAFYQLSEGEKSVIALVGDLSRRLAIANPKRENPLEGDGIVLIDEIDLHLHPKWQEKIFPALQNTFPNIQFIVSTHAPKVLESVDENIQVIRLHEDAETHLVLAEPMEPMNGWDVNTILEDYMDTEVYNRKTTELLEQINVYLNEKAYDEAEKLVNKLAWMTSEENTKVVRARILIAKGR